MPRSLFKMFTRTMESLDRLATGLDKLVEFTISQKEAEAEAKFGKPEIEELTVDERRGTGGFTATELPESYVGPSEEYKADLEDRRSARTLKGLEPDGLEDFEFSGPESSVGDAPAASEFPPKPPAPPDAPPPVDPPGWSGTHDTFETPEFSKPPAAASPYSDGREEDSLQGFERSGRNFSNEVLDHDTESRNWQHMHNQASNQALRRVIDDLADDFRELDELRSHLELSRLPLENI